MDLFPPLQTKITVPEKLLVSTKVGGNRVRKLGNKSFVTTVSIQPSEHHGLLKVFTELPAPFNELYLRKWNTRAEIPDNSFCLKLSSFSELNDIDQNTEFSWAQYPVDASINPEGVHKSWKGAFHFRVDEPEEETKGLRRPQLGALHAISAHFATDKGTDPATIVLPTGTGKTETMIATLVYHGLSPVLVVVPSNSLREQLEKKFLTLGCLPELGVVNSDAQLPYVAKLSSGLMDNEAAQEITEKANVIIATPNALSSGSEAATNILCRRCSHLFIDEAHHVSAKSWSEVRDRFVGKGILQFTATPFRNDKQSLGGRIIFNYTMGEAQRAGYFKPIQLHAVEEFFDDQADRTIARKAVQLLDQDLKAGLDHILMARVSSKKRANDLLSVYQDIARDHEPIVVHSTFTKRDNSACLEKLEARESRVVICVDMLGEGYDLPNLKVAAIHDIHKSLAIALQFIGRFTRSGSDTPVGNASVILNTADPGVEGSLQKLYAQDADWDAVLRRLSESRIAREVKLQEVVDQLKQGVGDLGEHISLWNLTPSFSAVLFQADCMEWDPTNFSEVMGNFSDYWHSISTNNELLVVLGLQKTPVKWGSYRNLKDVSYKLLVAQWDKARKALFVFSSDYKAFRVERFAKEICGVQCEPVSGERVFNVLNGIEFPLVRNLGASQIGAISFTQFFGPNVTDGLSQIEASQSNLSNIAAKGYEAGECVVWGCSQKKGKIWSPQSGGTLTDWSDWVKSAWDKIATGGIDESNITRDFLRPTKIETYHNASPISVQWGEQLLSTFEDRVSLTFDGAEIPFYLIDIALGHQSEEGIFITLSGEGHVAVYRLSIFEEAPGYRYELVEGEAVAFVLGRFAPTSFEEYMDRDPVVIQYVDGAFSYNKWLVKIKESVGLFNPSDIEVRDWNGINIRSESMGLKTNKNTVQYQSYLDICDHYDVIINDDEQGEAADLVAIKVVDHQIHLHLIHCKFSSESTPGSRLKDLYEVCGQAQRSIHWKHAGIIHLYKHILHREQLWKKRGGTRFLKGKMGDLATIKNRARTAKLSLDVSIVQPGLSVRQVTDEMLKLLGCTSLFIKKTTEADLHVIASE
ncbi:MULTISPECIES: DEAD/DEAH box helicase [Marinobacter]|uniref:DEAD/DEAH box helicase n=1 Tax=Marinobacter TaxID=2742 RepID=UPI001B10885C|nr:DEAD/DEAH box helicase family protein [Marinobacter sp.]MBO6812111.1 DEAD/DEAH box helicase family protein [Marinobacter sp.]MBO6873641.1 DEAD/DEAH box helicase family protein [Marinobacter sp.]